MRLSSEANWPKTPISFFWLPITAGTSGSSRSPIRQVTASGPKQERSISSKHFVVDWRSRLPQARYATIQNPGSFEYRLQAGSFQGVSHGAMVAALKNLKVTL